MLLPPYLIINGVKAVNRPQGILTELAELYRRWQYWSQDFARDNQPTDHLVLELHPGTRRLNIRFLAETNHQPTYPTNREAYFLFDLQTQDGPFVELLLTYYPGAFRALGLQDKGLFAHHPVQVLSRPEVDLIFTWHATQDLSQ